MLTYIFIEDISSFLYRFNPSSEDKASIFDLKTIEKPEVYLMPLYGKLPMIFAILYSKSNRLPILFYYGF